MSVQRTALAAEARTGTARELISGEEFEAVRITVQTNNPEMDGATAERIVAEALAFVAACAVSTARGLRPSRIVDEGWHALILHTRTYSSLCERLGRFVHHVPELPDPSRHHPGSLAATQAIISAAGYRTDPFLWLPPTDSSIPVAATCEHSPPGPEGTCTEGDCSGHPN